MQNYYQPQYMNYPVISQIPQYQQSQQSLINCKIVESADSVKYQEVPFGGYSVFVQADLSAIYLKSWNTDGTTQITSYLKTVLTDEESTDQYSDMFSKIQESINELTKKIDNIKPPTTGTITRAKKGA